METDKDVLARLKPGCICMGIRLHRIMEAVEQGATTFEEVARMTGIGRGDCGGRRCGEKIAAILRERSTRNGETD